MSDKLVVENGIPDDPDAWLEAVLLKYTDKMDNDAFGVACALTDLFATGQTRTTLAQLADAARTDMIGATRGVRTLVRLGLIKQRGDTYSALPIKEDERA